MSMADQVILMNGPMYHSAPNSYGMLAFRSGCTIVLEPRFDPEDMLQLIARLYTEEDRYRDAFQVMRVSLNVHPNSELTRKIQQEAGETFDSLFLAGKVPEGGK